MAFRARRTSTVEAMIEVWVILSGHFHGPLPDRCACGMAWDTQRPWEIAILYLRPYRRPYLCYRCYCPLVCLGLCLLVRYHICSPGAERLKSHTLEFLT